MITKTLYKKGFTLMELLVVVGIIAILTAVVLVALNNARSKGGDAGVQSNLRSVANEAEIFFVNNTNSYLPSGGTAITTAAACPAYNASGTSMVAKDKPIADAIAQATSNGGNDNSCYNSASAWAVAVGLKTSATASWCVDSTGASKAYAGAVGSAINSSTGACN